MESSENNKRKYEESSTSEEQLQTKRALLDEESMTVKITDMPDQILLDIFKYLDARDLKALGFSSVRFCNVISDRTLWSKVNAGPDRIGPKRMYWMLTHGLSESTQVFKLQGYSRDISGCHGYFHYRRPNFIYETEEEKVAREQAPRVKGFQYDRRQNCIVTRPHTQFDPDAEEIMYMKSDVNSYNFIPKWPNYIQKVLPESKKPVTKPFDDLRGCSGPRFTLTYPMLKSLTLQCPYMKELYLEYCNFNHMTTNICDFPKDLTLLSLRGAKVFNMCHKDPMLGKIHIHLPKLEYLDLSECHWLEPDILMSLSKLDHLKSLFLRSCSKLRDFVAYASLSTRHGFKTLKLLDYRGTPVGDSEVSPLGWLPQLTHMLLSPMSPRVPECTTHKHFKDDPIFIKEELHDWELEIPPYYAEPPACATEDKIPRPAASQAPPPRWARPRPPRDPNAPGRAPRAPRAPIPIEQDYYVASGSKYERARLEELHGVQGSALEVSDSDSGEEDVMVPYARPAPEEYYTPVDCEYDLDESGGAGGVSRNLLTFSGDSVRAYRLRDVTRDELYRIMSRPPAAAPHPAANEQIQCFRFNREMHTRTVVTDAAVRYFGVAADVRVLAVNARGVLGPAPAGPARPRQSALRVLGLRGYTRITDSALFHLRTAAPHLLLVDVRDTGCSEAGIKAFKQARPMVKVMHNCY